MRLPHRLRPPAWPTQGSATEPWWARMQEAFLLGPEPRTGPAESCPAVPGLPVLQLCGGGGAQGVALSSGCVVGSPGD